MSDFPEISLPYLIFSGSALVVVIVAWWLLSRIINARMKSRLERLNRVPVFDAVRTSSPYNEPVEKARAAARVNVKTRYTVVRNLFAILAGAFIMILATLPILGTVPRAFISFLVAVVLAVIGVAARPLVENLISGVVISLSNQVRIGDTVLLDGDYYGTIEDINITHTVVKLWDWRRYVVPNSRMLQKEVLSYTTKDTYLWAYVSFEVSARADLTVVEELAVEAAKRSSFNANFEAPQFWLRDMTATSITCWLAAWAKNPEDSWYLRSDMRRELVKSFQKHSIDLHLNVHSLIEERRLQSVGS